jgi:hypothetical protein
VGAARASDAHVEAAEVAGSGAPPGRVAAELARLATGPLGPARARAVARAVAGGAPLSNRGIARAVLLQRAPAAAAAGDDLQARARQALAAEQTDWAGAAKEILAGIVDTLPPELRGAVTGFRYDPAAAQSDPTASRRAVKLIAGELVGGDILVRWVANGFLPDAVSEVRNALTAAAPSPTAPAAPAAGTPFRAEILKLADQVDAKGVQEKLPVRDESGKVVPGTGGIGRWITQDQLDANRKLLGKNYTSCGTFLSNVWNLAKAAAKKQHPNIRIDTTHREFAQHKSPIPGAWNPASPGMSGSPSPGDAYYLQFTDTREQSHVGIVKSVTRLDDDREQWVTADGGQRDTPGGLDRVCERTRTYVRSENLVYGGENADKEPRWLFGWTDVDKLVS